MTRHTELLVEHATRLGDVRAPSLCEGWSRAHVLAHVARNAEAILRLSEWALDGQPREMYPGGTAARDAEIEEGGCGRTGRARRPPPGGRVRRRPHRHGRGAGPRLAALAGPLAVDEVEMRGGLKVPPLVLPLLRLREVVFHHVDLDDGFTFADVEPELLQGFVDDAVAPAGRAATRPTSSCTATRATSGRSASGARHGHGTTRRAAALAGAAGPAGSAPTCGLPGAPREAPNPPGPWRP